LPNKSGRLAIGALEPAVALGGKPVSPRLGRVLESPEPHASSEQHAAAMTTFTHMATSLTAHVLSGYSSLESASEHSLARAELTSS